MPARQESIPGLLKSLKIRALAFTHQTGDHFFVNEAQKRTNQIKVGHITVPGHLRNSLLKGFWGYEDSQHIPAQSHIQQLNSQPRVRIQKEADLLFDA